ncbi:MAG: 2-succinyl-5-enolpyruvyl-6-hydroxy-3-cyclohexene-1-carboxylic-acid synthase [Ignavibacteriales bacterium]|nr:2-succinyl-5-enolpyruvyl-6-hydroxy-3-cyclohexene-1-carboxylic-acid synthase [Ignavibacteriales bacterium]
MKVNPNFIQAGYFIRTLLANNIRQIIISPGSRSTSLALACISNKKLQCTSVIDERTAAFYATGVARVSGYPVVLLCTSGTAVAEYYPAIIEAYQQRIPLIVCTADRPEHLIGTGANQTINQRNIYKNHIRYAFDAGLPEMTSAYFSAFKKSLHEAITVCLFENKGPVHINLPYKKPFEPHEKTAEISTTLLQSLTANVSAAISKKNAPDKKDLQRAQVSLSLSSRILVLAGPGLYTPKDRKAIVAIAKRLQAPIFADIGSGLRFNGKKELHIISHFDTLLRSGKIGSELHPDCILVFGMGMVSATLNRFLEKLQASRIIINPFGDRIDPTDNKRIIINAKPAEIIDDLHKNDKAATVSNVFFKQWISLNAAVRDTISGILPEGKLHEVSLSNLLIENIPENSAVMLSNSLTYRVFDDFAEPAKKHITVYQNRGASGIDGIISTASGIASVNKNPVYLIIGDVTFYYDLNALLLLKNARVPVTVLLFSNGGGRIFDVLPVKDYLDSVGNFFRTPVAYDVEKVVSAFNGVYIPVESFSGLAPALAEPIQKGSFKVIDLQIDALFAQQTRDALRASCSPRIP